MDFGDLYKVMMVFSDNSVHTLGAYVRYNEAEEAFRLFLEFPFFDNVVFVAIVKDGFLFKKERVDYTG